MLDKIAKFYDQEVEAQVDALTSLIEPLLIAVIGGVRRRGGHRALHADVQHHQADQVERIARRGPTGPRRARAPVGLPEPGIYPTRRISVQPGDGASGAREACRNLGERAPMGCASLHGKEAKADAQAILAARVRTKRASPSSS